MKALDRAKAYSWPHGQIATYVREKYRVSSWWSQTVTVGYERIKGLRAIGQRRDGSFEVSKSKTLPVPLAGCMPGTLVVVGFIPRGNQKSQVTLSHGKLPIALPSPA
ncbi:MAG TPA: hypothetical protein VJ808_03450 [Gemmatimonadales bacterium]|nr:hypothetical protein [Gemmatimonadales bacterium]